MKESLKPYRSFIPTHSGSYILEYTLINHRESHLKSESNELKLEA